MKIFLYDISRFFYKREAITPTGIDRVDLRYLSHLNRKYPKQIHYVFNYADGLFLVDESILDILIRELDQRWNSNKKVFDHSIVKAVNEEIGKITETKKSIKKKVPKKQKQKLAQTFSEILTLRLENSQKIYNKQKKLHTKFSGMMMAILYFVISYPKQIFLYYKRKLKNKKITPATRRATTSEVEKEGALGDTLYSFLVQNRENTIYYVNISHHGIDNDLAFTDLYTAFSVKFIFYIHDIIPISFPEYVKDGDKQKHMKRMDTVLSLGSSLILTNSEDSKVEILKYAVESGKFLNFSADRIVPMTIGVEDQIQMFDKEQSHVFESLKNSAYFVVVGTIEPRKNHLLLLNLWREFIKKLDHSQIPKLIIIGKRGWENENIIDMLDRCDSLKGHVHEMSNLSDKELFGILKSSKALLFPSFVEGWGMPLVEAMTLNVPVICSDIPVFKEAGQNLAEYISPINGEKWGEVILDFTHENSRLRVNQLERLKNFEIPQWSEHFKKFDTLLDNLTNSVFTYRE